MKHLLTIAIVAAGALLLVSPTTVFAAEEAEVCIDERAELADCVDERKSEYDNCADAATTDEEKSKCRLSYHEGQAYCATIYGEKCVEDTTTTATSNTSSSVGSSLRNPLGITDLREIVGRLIKAALGLAGVAALAMFVWGGTQWLLSGGNAEMVKKGKSTLTWAVIGLVVLFTSYTLVSTIITALTSGIA